MGIESYIDVAMGLNHPNIRLCNKQYHERNNSEYAYIFTFEDGEILFYWVKQRKLKDGYYCKQRWLFR